MDLTSSLEDYLKAVLVLYQQNGYVRCVDVAEHLGVSKPSVSRAMKELIRSGHIVKEAGGALSLTARGQHLAEQIYEKHQFFAVQLMEVGVSPEIADQEACKMEHGISEKSFQKLKEALKE